MAAPQRVLCAEGADHRRSDAAQGDAHILHDAPLHLDRAGEADLRDRLRAARADLAVVVAPALGVRLLAHGGTRRKKDARDQLAGMEIHLLVPEMERLVADAPRAP